MVGIFLLFVCGLWIFKRQTYEGPVRAQSMVRALFTDLISQQFDLILGESNTAGLELDSEKQFSDRDKDGNVAFQHPENGSV